MGNGFDSNAVSPGFAEVARAMAAGIARAATGVTRAGTASVRAATAAMGGGRRIAWKPSLGDPVENHLRPLQEVGSQDS